jgi:uncharacterized DUF497 family protein
MDEIIITECTSFDWDEGNRYKSQNKHNVSQWECEQVFFNNPLLLYEDAKHSHMESRSYALGKTDIGRKLFIVFTIRHSLIRVISARDMSKKERTIYDKI